MGASHSWEGGQTPLLDSAHQLQVRYVASSNTYELELPETDQWFQYHPSGGGALVDVRSTGTQYSALLSWLDGATFFGTEAIGIATPASGVPVSGSASYSGQIAGDTPEIHSNVGLGVRGAIELSFNFGLGSLSGSVTPTLFSAQNLTTYDLGTLNFVQTVYSTGSTTFSGKFDTALPGMNSLSGQFTGPHAEELIGNFAFPYRSPIDSQTYQADGAFVGSKKP